MAENSLRDKKLRDKAQALYFADYKPDQISQVLEIPLEDVRKLAFGVDGNGKAPGCWMALKAAVGPAAVSAYIFEKRHVFERTTGLALSILNKSLTDLQKKVYSPIKEEQITLSLKDMKDLAAIVVDFDKIVRLESGQATEIVDNIGLSPQEAREIIESDPFARHLKKVAKTEEIEDAQYKETEESSKNEGIKNTEGDSGLYNGESGSSLIFEEDAEDIEGS